MPFFLNNIRIHNFLGYSASTARTFGFEQGTLLLLMAKYGITTKKQERLAGKERKLGVKGSFQRSELENGKKTAQKKLPYTFHQTPAPFVHKMSLFPFSMQFFDNLPAPSLPLVTRSSPSPLIPQTLAYALGFIHLACISGNSVT